MQSLITSVRADELPTLAVFKGTPLYGHLARHGWKPWRFGQHGVDVLKKTGPLQNGEPEYYRFALDPIGDGFPLSDTRTLRGLLKAVFEDACSKAKVAKGTFIDVNPR